MGRLSDRRIVITGAASGMGRAIALAFHAEGAKLALLDRNADGVALTAAQADADAFGCDVANRAEVADVIARAAQSLGGIDGVVNAAGILDIKPADELTPESWDRMIAVNLTGPFNIVHAALPHLRAAEWATIVNISSVSGVMPMAGTSGYSASKAGVLMWTRCLGMDLGPHIRANAILPGVIETEMTRYLSENPEHRAAAEERVALKRLGDTQDIVRAALFFSTEDSAFTTGAALPVDGGFSWR
ncbi:SDR family NAD(P)-dependent oxidoreductase [Sphingomonas sp. BIUV-7]|uniref:SDR family NAD(P)-dependent oxidoreductase n=1 Tax=Sphingomonas natans TaxID=3063330 RepID=A0ABT8Y814_9SPHN|nr:SDR family NAD(P)-dependent oxidoreductase [Sphingomonas sp. BIUV-7]MDO6414458.1 SDR family NAD(P)-dependent oxidoreductase [Sphingomonas sp. BIUV-7]